MQSCRGSNSEVMRDTKDHLDRCSTFVCPVAGKKRHRWRDVAGRAERASRDLCPAGVVWGGALHFSPLPLGAGTCSCCTGGLLVYHR